jgi:hypothetical protein
MPMPAKLGFVLSGDAREVKMSEIDGLNTNAVRHELERI